MVAYKLHWVGAASEPVREVLEKPGLNCTFLSAERAVETWSGETQNPDDVWLFATPSIYEEILAVTDTLTQSVSPALASYGALLDALAEGGIPHIPYRIAEDEEQAESAAREMSSQAWAVCSNRGRRERAVRTPEETSLAVLHVSTSPSDSTVIVSPVSDEREITVQGFERDNDFHLLCILSHDARRSYHRFPMALTAPAELNPLEESLIAERAKQALTACRIRNTPFSITLSHFDSDWVVQDIHLCPWWGPAPVDLAGKAYGQSLLERFLSSGEPAEKPTLKGGAAVRWLDSQTGRIDAIEGVEEARAMPGVCDVHIGLQPGDNLRHMVDTSIRDRLGYVVATGAGAQEARSRAAEAAERIRVATRNVLFD